MLAPPAATSVFPQCGRIVFKMAKERRDQELIGWIWAGSHGRKSRNTDQATPRDHHRSGSIGALDKLEKYMALVYGRSRTRDRRRRWSQRHIDVTTRRLAVHQFVTIEVVGLGADHD
jgi:hypothetical protein